ncbi:MAG TPA: tRNA uridine-5-carboxymethylaminomethyl(34) synthesis GTPase MnmE [Desulfotignum sp.]|nr:tRNA uridine-5-carboxymethylaminomethyl(34) synthesis GTPase MnmE [Desulfotignum sp.]
MNDTIAAIATPYGSGGIGVIRISGPDAVDIAARVFSRTRSRGSLTGNLETHRVYHGYILDNGEVIDEVLLIPMHAPRSYTAEDVVEIQAHSGTVVLRQILELLLTHGARLAEPGEFTRRAFLNQRIDLTQAEAVADIINARSAAALKFASAQNLGALKEKIQDMRGQLIHLLSLVEVCIDFPEDAGEQDLSVRGVEILDTALCQCREFIRQHTEACFLKEGIRIAICGKPNVGKSSLMNRLLAREKSIVTALPGTTRDPIQEGMNMNGIPFVITDTAGIHDTDDLVEIIGIERAKGHIRDADLVLFMVEPGTTLSEMEFKKMLPPDKRTLLVINKIDLVRDHEGVQKPGGPGLPKLPEPCRKFSAVHVSALHDRGIRQLKEKIVSLCIQDLTLDGSAVIPNLRHKTALTQVVSYLEAAKQGFQTGQPEETLAIDLKNSIDSLGTITGETASLDILESIFNNFCSGK